MLGEAVLDAAAENRNHARRIGAAGLVSARIGAVEKRLVGEVELGRPGCHEPARELLPALVQIAGGRDPLEGQPGPARKFLEALLVDGKAQTARELQVGRELIIDFAKPRVGIDPVGIDAEKIIVALSIHVGQRIGVDIGTAKPQQRLVHVGGIGRNRSAEIGEVTVEGNVGCVWGVLSAVVGIDLLGKQAECVEEDVVVFHDVVVQIIAARDEVERPAEIRAQAQFLVKLLRVFLRYVLADDGAGAAQLRVAKYRRCGRPERWGRPRP